MTLEASEVFSASDVQEFIIKLNRTNQIFIDGETVDGYNIGVYSALTASLNQGRVFTLDGVSKTKRAGGNMFLLDEGDFFRSFKVIVKNDGFEIYADDKSKYDQPLEKRFGKLVGLSEDSKSQLREFIRPYIIKKLRKKAFG